MPVTTELQDRPQDRLLAAAGNLKEVIEILRGRRPGKGTRAAQRIIAEAIIEIEVSPPGLSASQYLALRTWMEDPDRKPANLSFTEGLLRDVAYVFEDASRKTKDGAQS